MTGGGGGSVKAEDGEKLIKLYGDRMVTVEDKPEIVRRSEEEESGYGALNEKNQD